eukprot:scaffold29700_cov66-Phaeocystis_antarctica.AAC.2
MAASGPLGEDERRRLTHHASERGDGRALGRQLASREHVFYRPSQRRLQQRGGARHRVGVPGRRVGKFGEARRDACGRTSAHTHTHTHTHTRHPHNLRGSSSISRLPSLAPAAAAAAADLVAPGVRLHPRSPRQACVRQSQSSLAG